MTAPQNLTPHPSDKDPLSRIHPSLRERLLGIKFDELSPEQTRLIFTLDAETILRDLVRDTRAKGILP
jgi:hypothetical protein